MSETIELGAAREALANLEEVQDEVIAITGDAALLMAEHNTHKEVIRNTGSA